MKESRPTVAGTFPPTVRKSLSIPPHKQSSLLAITRNKKTAFAVFFFAGDGGIEPPPMVLETIVLPLY